MDLDTLHLVIFSPEETLYEGEVRWAQIPLTDGWIGIEPGHAPLVGAVARGKLLFAEKGKTRELAISGGVLRVTPQACLVLVPGQHQAEDPGAEEAIVADIDYLEQALDRTLHSDTVNGIEFDE